MAARRLIAVLLVLLVVSSIAAALAPEARRAETTSTEPTAPNSQPGPDTTDPQAGAKPESEEVPAGTLVERTISADPGADQGKQGSGASGRATPPSIDAAVGDRVTLQVDAEETVAIEIPDLGLLETAAAGAPARFDLLLREPGSFAVEIAGGATVGTIDVAEPGAGAGSRPGAGGSDGRSGKSSAKSPGEGSGGSEADSGSSDAGSGGPDIATTT